MAVKVLFLAMLSIIIISCSKSDEPRTTPKSKDTAQIEQAIPSDDQSNNFADKLVLPSDLSEDKTVRGKNSGAMISVIITSLSNSILGISESLTPSNAQSIVKSGGILVGDADGKIYFIYNAEGNIANEHLIKYAGKRIQVIGKEIKLGDMNFIIADKFRN